MPPKRFDFSERIQRDARKIFPSSWMLHQELMEGHPEFIEKIVRLEVDRLDLAVDVFKGTKKERSCVDRHEKAKHFMDKVLEMLSSHSADSTED